MRNKNHAVCDRCHKKIKWIKINSENRMFDPTPCTFVPSREKEEFYATARGVVIMGVRARDGQIGYRPHNCYV
ncbi:MAG: hypothetical protein LBU77_05455 [Clostridiales bacterium]|jgi:hypothetical protein|nr:hypothetical protein [Clostridiales bacterium]